MKIGVNFQGFKCADYQNRLGVIQPPKNYISDSFKIFAENGLNCVRVPVYWESFENDQPGFKEELDNISNQADNKIFHVFTITISGCAPCTLVMV